MTNREEAARLDAIDPLAAKRGAFRLPDGLIYLDGNSLGPLTHAARAALEQTIDVEWGDGLIGSWNTADWVGLPRRIGALIAPLTGAEPGDVICTDGTSINLFKVLSLALDLRRTRSRVVSERHNFPTDLYVAEQAIARAGHDQQLTRVDSTDELDRWIDDDLAVLLLTHVDYRTGAMHDLARITAQARAAGALVVWDLAHSAGAVPVELRAAGVDFAIGCGYKYLNGGPGAPAFVYAHPRHHGTLDQPLAGWFAHADPFAFDARFEAAADMRAFLSGTPSVLGMRALEAALGVWVDVDMTAVRAKSIALCELFIATVEARCADSGLMLASPRDASARGSQVSFCHPQAYAVMRALIEHGVVGDMRAPDILRFGFAPLYTRYVDVIDAADALARILEAQLYQAGAHGSRAAVT